MLSYLLDFICKLLSMLACRLKLSSIHDGYYCLQSGFVACWRGQFQRCLLRWYRRHREERTHERLPMNTRLPPEVHQAQGDCQRPRCPLGLLRCGWVQGIVFPVGDIHTDTSTCICRSTCLEACLEAELSLGNAKCRGSSRGQLRPFRAGLIDAISPRCLLPRLRFYNPAASFDYYFHNCQISRSRSMLHRIILPLPPHLSCFCVLFVRVCVPASRTHTYTFGDRI